MPNSRIYIRPNEEPGQRFFTNGKLDISQISKLPALLVPETGGSDLRYAKVAHITKITEGHQDTAIQYAVDASIPPISNHDLESCSAQLSLGGFGLSHTCWRLCDVDLYRLILLIHQKSTISPKVFTVEAMKAQASDLVSVMMPFKAEFNPVYSALQKSVTALGLSCVRADDIWEHHTIIQDIVTLIARAGVVICDCSGKNPNVFYEAGIAHTLGKEVILIAQSEDDVPFDLRHLRYIRYLPNREGLDNLSQALVSRLKSIIN